MADGRSPGTVGTYVRPSSPVVPPDLGTAEAAFAQGMAVSAERQSHFREPMGGAVARPAETTLQPMVHPGESGGVT